MSKMSDFKEAMRDAAEAVGQGGPYTDGALDLMYAALREFSLDTIQQALVDHINDPVAGKWRPNASYIRAQIERRQPVLWIDADEAYALIPRTEAQPGLLNQVTSVALAAAAPFLYRDRPDENAARMAFRAAYNRHAEQEKRAGRPPEYFVTPGGTHEAQQDVIAEGVRLGLLPPSCTPKEAPRLGSAPPSQEARAALLGYKPKIIGTRETP